MNNYKNSFNYWIKRLSCEADRAKFERTENRGGWFVLDQYMKSIVKVRTLKQAIRIAESIEGASIQGV